MIARSLQKVFLFSPAHTETLAAKDTVQRQPLIGPAAVVHLDRYVGLNASVRFSRKEKMYDPGKGQAFLDSVQYLKSRTDTRDISEERINPLLWKMSKKDNRKSEIQTPRANMQYLILCSIQRVLDLTKAMHRAGIIAWTSHYNTSFWSTVK